MAKPTSEEDDMIKIGEDYLRAILYLLIFLVGLYFGTQIGIKIGGGLEMGRAIGENDAYKQLMGTAKELNKSLKR